MDSQNTKLDDENQKLHVVINASSVTMNCKLGQKWSFCIENLDKFALIERYTDHQ